MKKEMKAFIISSDKRYEDFLNESKHWDLKMEEAIKIKVKGK